MSIFLTLKIKFWHIFTFFMLKSEKNSNFDILFYLKYKILTNFDFYLNFWQFFVLKPEKTDQL